MKKVFISLLKITLVTLLIPIICFGIVMYAFIGGATNVSIIKSAKSPDGNYVAYAFIRNSGATSKESYNISILKNGKSIGKSAGNIFITHNKIDMYWYNSKKLVIMYAGNYEIFKDKSKYKDIDIEYMQTSTLD